MIEGSEWRVLRALIAFGVGLLLTPVFVAIVAHAIGLRRTALEMLESLLKF